MKNTIKKMDDANKEEWKSISVKNKTKKRIVDLMHKSDEYDPLINKMIDAYIKTRKKPR